MVREEHRSVTRDRSIDGWRGLSVIFVIAGHLISFRFVDLFRTEPFRVLLSQDPFPVWDLARNVLLRLATLLPSLGVGMFFVISGYLITTLLIAEENRHGSVSLAAFYVRRVFRILPAFYVYLLFLGGLSLLEVIVIQPSSFLWTGLFLCDLPESKCSWWMGHTWTLSVEEQFYIVWPAAFIAIPKGLRVHFLVAMLLVFIAISFEYSVSVNFIHIAVGALLAISSRLFSMFVGFASGGAIALATAAIFLHPFFASTPLLSQASAAAAPFLLALILFGTINGRGPFVWLVEAEWIRLVGLASYSLYLWQQLSTGSVELYRGHSWMEQPFMFVLFALASLFLVERPMIRFGHRISSAIIRRRVKFGANGRPALASDSSRIAS